MPVDELEALFAQLFGGGAGVLFVKKARLGVGGAIGQAVVEIGLEGGEVGAAGAGVLDDAKVSAVRGARLAGTPEKSRSSAEAAEQQTYMDFLCGWTLQEMVWPSSTLTHRTI